VQGEDGRSGQGGGFRRARDRGGGRARSRIAGALTPRGSRSSRARSETAPSRASAREGRAAGTLAGYRAWERRDAAPFARRRTSSRTDRFASASAAASKRVTSARSASVMRREACSASHATPRESTSSMSSVGEIIASERNGSGVPAGAAFRRSRPGGLRRKASRTREARVPAGRLRGGPSEAKPTHAGGPVRSGDICLARPRLGVERA